MFFMKPNGFVNVGLRQKRLTQPTVLETLPGGGTPGEVFYRSYSLTGAAALHANFRVQFRQLVGSGVDYDYWHADGVCLLDARAAYYAMDETACAGANCMIDSCGKSNHASPVGSAVPASPASAPALAGDPGTCGYADIPDNTNTCTGAYLAKRCCSKCDNYNCSSNGCYT